VLLVVSNPKPAGAFGNDPLGILRGVENTRLSLHTGRLDLECHYRNARGETVRDIAVVFDGTRRRYVVEKISGKRTGGLTRVMFDGTRVVRFDGLKTAWIRDLGNTTADLMFDPRLLGVTSRYTWGETIEFALGYRNAKNISLVGDERIDRVATWHVRVRTARDEQLDFWIDQSKDFRVRRAESRDGAQFVVTTSTYDSASVLPTEVRSVTANSSGMQDERRIVVKRVEVDVPIDGATWTLAGLDLPVATALNDDRLQRRIGYWDGTRVAEDVREKKGMLPEGTPEQSRDSRWKWDALLIANGTVLAVCGLVLFLRYRRSRAG
jgi:hypothetical protein